MCVCVCVCVKIVPLCESMVGKRDTHIKLRPIRFTHYKLSAETSSTNNVQEVRDSALSFLNELRQRKGKDSLGPREVGDFGFLQSRILGGVTPV